MRQSTWLYSRLSGQVSPRLVDVARYFIEFTNSESCGKCVPCRCLQANALQKVKLLGKRQGCGWRWCESALDSSDLPEGGDGSVAFLPMTWMDTRILCLALSV